MLETQLSQYLAVKVAMLEKVSVSAIIKNFIINEILGRYAEDVHYKHK